MTILVKIYLRVHLFIYKERINKNKRLNTNNNKMINN